MADGVFPRIRQFFFGEEGVPKAEYSRWELKETSEFYAGMDKYYREFRRDSLVRGCIVTNAFFACMAKGFETALEVNEAAFEKPPSDQKKESLLEEYAHVKKHIDDLNRTVNMDQAIFTAQVNRSIYGKVGFEIVTDNKDAPTRLLPLNSELLKPEIDENWNLTGYEYKGKKKRYEPHELLYFLNLSLEAGLEGLSDIEPIIDTLETRRTILKRDLKETAHTLWAPILILTCETKGLPKAKIKEYIKDVVKNAKPGKTVGVSERVTAQVVERKPDLPGLIATLEYCDLEIIGNFKTPRFLLGREKTVNRATAYCELETYIGGVVANIQRFFKREIEHQWYDPQVRRILNTPEGEAPKVLIKHNWNLISTIDIIQMADVISKLYGQGMGVIDREKAYELMNWEWKEEI